MQEDPYSFLQAERERKDKYKVPGIGKKEVTNPVTPLTSVIDKDDKKKINTVKAVQKKYI